jgi:hypothetical protein
MTLAKPFAYWVRNTSYTNALGADDPILLNRCIATRSTQDLLVRTHLHTRVVVTVTTSAPPTPGWIKGMRWDVVAAWSPDAIGTLPDPDSGDPSIVATGWLTPNFIRFNPATNDYQVSWEQTEAISAKVFRSAPDPNSTFPAVQSGVSLVDIDGALDPFPVHSITFRAHQYLETLWNSDQAP